MGSSLVAKAPSDGYTILMGTVSTHAVSAGIYKKLTYDPIRDFVPITLVADIPNVLLVHPSLPVKSAMDLVKLAKLRPKELTFASSGIGTLSHLAGELLKYTSKVEIEHVPYKGSAPALVDLLTGQVTMSFVAIPSAQPYLKGGRLKPIAVTSAKRLLLLPNVPTMIESGVPDYEVSTWFGIFAPKDTPTSIVQKLNAEIVRILRLPEVKQYLTDQGAEPIGNSLEDFARFVGIEVKKWTTIVKNAGVQSDF